MALSEARYGASARLLHWLMAILIIAMIPAGFIMIQDGVSRSLQNTLFIFHKNMGVLLLLLALLRIAYRMTHKPAPLPDDMPSLQKRVAGLSHLALYTLIFVMPVAGYIRVKAGGFPIETLDAMGIPSLAPRSDALAGIAKSIHYYGGIALAALIAMHIGAALYHGIVKKDGVFSRMWPPVGGGTR